MEPIAESTALDVTDNGQQRQQGEDDAAIHLDEHLNESIVQVVAPEEALCYEKIKKGSQKGGIKLVDSVGFAYCIKVSALDISVSTNIFEKC